jgi:hypothetical protein
MRAPGDYGAAMLGRALVGLVLLSTVADAAVPVPTVMGPITGPGNPFVASTSFNLAPLGYVQEEFFLSGTATAYTSPTTLASDGKWVATPGSTAAYETRILVRRPVDPTRFNGTVVVEWLNVSAGLDSAPDWIFAHTLLMREGYVWVGVSAQFAGVEGSGGPLGLPLALKVFNPARYGVLVHPGDSFSYDMFSQVGAALRASTGVRPLATLVADRIIAMGESQSAFRLVTYVNAVHPLAEVYDGFLIHSRGGNGAPLSQTPQPTVPTPDVAFIRDDLSVPVLTLETETDLLVLGYLPSRQRNSKRFRLWEVAGTAHGDLYQLASGMRDIGPAALDTTYAPPTPSPLPGIIDCDEPVNAGPHHYVVSAAISALDTWIRTGQSPGRAHHLAVKDGAFSLDRHDNVRRGVRTPQLDVPIATLSGLGQTGSAFCSLFGTTYPFDAATLRRLYKTHAKYVAAIERATKRAVRAGFILSEDATAIVAAAEASSIGD